MKKYIYTSDIPCHFSMRIENNVQELSLYKDQTYDFPEDHARVKRMVAQGLLKLADNSDKGKKQNTTSKTSE